MVKLIYISPYTDDQKLAALKLQTDNNPGIIADLIKQTCLYLNADGVVKGFGESGGLLAALSPSLSLGASNFALM